MAATPNPEVFTVYDSAGVPLAGVLADMAFTVYKTDAGVNQTAPAISEIGGGGYKFLPTFTAGHGTYYVISTGHFPAFYARYVRPEEAYPDLILNVQQFQQGRRQIVTSGGDANKEVVYAPDNVTVLQKYALKDSAGAPTTVNPYDAPTTS